MSSPLILGILLASAAVTLATIVGWLMMAIAARRLLAGGGSSAPNRALLLAQARLLPLAAVAIVVPTQIHAFVSYEVGGTESAGFMLLVLGLSGILLCAGWNERVVRYSLAGATAPLAVARYTYDALPPPLRDLAPTPASGF